MQGRNSSVQRRAGLAVVVGIELSSDSLAAVGGASREGGACREIRILMHAATVCRLRDTDSKTGPGGTMDVQAQLKG